MTGSVYMNIKRPYIKFTMKTEIDQIYHPWTS